jgi:hypothetical protein
VREFTLFPSKGGKRIHDWIISTSRIDIDRNLSSVLELLGNIINLNNNFSFNNYIIICMVSLTN